jgi:hypothetical protein
MQNNKRLIFLTALLFAQTLFAESASKLVINPKFELANLPKSNPWLAKSPYAISHHNAAQTDATEVEGPSISKRLT